MAKEFEPNQIQYDVDITNGTGTKSVADGVYSASANIPGYDSSTISPVSVTVQAGVTVYDFSIAAAGSLTLHVTEDGTADGVAVEGATFVRTDSTGTATYGKEITTGPYGNAVFKNVPYGSDETIYFKQTGTAVGHEFDPVVREATLTSSTKTVRIQNAPVTERVFNIKDANYTEKAIVSGTLTLTK